MERRVAAVLVLVTERGLDGDVCAEPATGGPDADLGFGGPRILVRAQSGIPADASDAKPALDARSRGYHILSWRRRFGNLCSGPKNRPFV